MGDLTREQTRMVEKSVDALKSKPVDQRTPQDYFLHAKILDLVGWSDMAAIYRGYGRERKAQVFLERKRNRSRKALDKFT